MAAKDTTHAATFRRLHDGPEILVLPGVWDIPSARVFADAGFAALGTTSSGIAWTAGQAAGQDAPWPVFLDACRRIARSVDLPVSFDVESGFGETPDAVGANVREAVEAGAGGINLEDGIADGTLREAEPVEEAIRAIRRTCDETRSDLFVNARTDVYLGGLTESALQLRETIRRGQRYAEAGADGFFVPGILRADDIRSVVREVPLPLNVYALPDLPGAAELAELGVRRVSLGCGPLQAVLARTRDVAEAVRRDAAWDSFTDDWMSYDDAIRLCTGGGDEAR